MRRLPERYASQNLRQELRLPPTERAHALAKRTVSRSLVHHGDASNGESVRQETHRSPCNLLYIKQ